MPKPALPEVLILRHGETEWNRAGRWQGDLDSPLTPQGYAQARAMGALLRDMGVTDQSHRFYSSPLGRARTTAALAMQAGGLNPDLLAEDARLREISVGQWTGRSRADIIAETGLSEDTHFLDMYAAAPGAETFEDIARRTRAFLDGLTMPSVIVTHGITSRVMRTIALGWELDRLTEVPGGQGVIHRIKDGAHDELVP